MSLMDASGREGWTATAVTRPQRSPGLTNVVLDVRAPCAAFRNRSGFAEFAGRDPLATLVGVFPRPTCTGSDPTANLGIHGRTRCALAAAVQVVGRQARRYGPGRGFGAGFTALAENRALR
jgi:hypothetical protein